MSAWDRVLALLDTNPVAGALVAIGGALAGMVLLALLRRTLPKDERHHGAVTLAFLFIGFFMGFVRLGVVAAGAGTSAAGRVLGALTTFFVAMGVMGTLVVLLFEVVPERARLRFPPILRDLLHVLAFLVVAFASLSQSGVNVVSLITTSAVLTAVVGLALQNTIANLFAGVVLNMDRALGIGDWVQIGPRTGRITEIRWRSTLLRTLDGDTVIIPNSQLTTLEVHNYSRPSPARRVWIKVGFHYKHPPNDVRRMLADVARETPGVLADPAPDAIPVEFGEFAFTYAVRFWIDDFVAQQGIEGEVRGRIWYAAHRAGLDMPYHARALLGAETAPAGDHPQDFDERVAALARVDLLAPLEKHEIEQLALRLHGEAFAAGEVVLRQGEPGDSLFLISRGEIAVSLARQGARQEIARLGPGKFFGEMSLMTGEPRAATCTAGTDALCYVIDHAAFQRLLTARPAIADQVSVLLASRQEALERMGSELSAMASRTRITHKDILARIRYFFDLD